MVTFPSTTLKFTEMRYAVEWVFPLIYVGISTHFLWQRTKFGLRVVLPEKDTGLEARTVPRPACRDDCGLLWV